MRQDETGNIEEWRRERDSNSRRAFALVGFQDRCIQPLCHPSATGRNLTRKSFSVNHILAINWFDVDGLGNLKKTPHAAAMQITLK